VWPRSDERGYRISILRLSIFLVRYSAVPPPPWNSFPAFHIQKVFQTLEAEPRGFSEHWKISPKNFRGLEKGSRNFPRFGKLRGGLCP
jgi:hypothetical protein